MYMYFVYTSKLTKHIRNVYCKANKNNAKHNNNYEHISGAEAANSNNNNNHSDNFIYTARIKSTTRVSRRSHTLYRFMLVSEFELCAIRFLKTTTTTTTKPQTERHTNTQPTSHLCMLIFYEAERISECF